MTGLIKLRKRRLEFDLGDYMSDKRVERDPIISGLLNRDVGLFMKPNFGKQIDMSLVLYFAICFSLSFLSPYSLFALYFIAKINFTLIFVVNKLQVLNLDFLLS
jgi:hypothetical protein